jgi:ABC-type protease/lipase transport system fused ATPase/permease subunit
MSGVRIESLTRVVRGPDGAPFTTVAPISLLVPAGRGVAVTGPDDAGGLALLRLVAGLDRKSAGEVERLRRPDEPRPAPGDDAWLRQETPLVSAFLPLLDGGIERAAEFVTGLEATCRRGVPPIAPAALRDFAGVEGAALSTRAEKLRLCVALAAALRPKALLLDLPRPFLTAAERRSLAAALRRALTAGAGLLLATQDETLIAAVCDEVLVIFDGVCTARGPSDEVLPAAVAAWRTEEAPA